MGQPAMFNSRIWSKKLKAAQGPEEKDEVILSMFEEVYSGNTLATKADLRILKAELKEELSSMMTARIFVIVALLNGLFLALIQFTK